MELKYTSRGPRLIEVNCRMGGGPVRLTNLLVWGVDLVEEHLLTCAGIPSRPPVAGRPLVHLAEYSINAFKSGVIANTEYLKVRRCSPPPPRAALWALCSEPRALDALCDLNPTSCAALESGAALAGPWCGGVVGFRV